MMVPRPGNEAKQIHIVSTEQLLCIVENIWEGEGGESGMQRRQVHVFKYKESGSFDCHACV